WLVAAVINTEGKDAKLNELLTTAAAVSPSSPAFATLTFHRIRLLKEANRMPEARAVPDKTLTGDRQQWPISAVNMFLSERWMVARNLEEFLRRAQREPAGFGDDKVGRE